MQNTHDLPLDFRHILLQYLYSILFINTQSKYILTKSFVRIYVDNIIYPNT